MNQNPKKGQVKGSVLLTVVGVMLVMVVFLMSTLTLTTASQKRSYYTYFETQAQYAAQAALDAITNIAYTNQEFYEFIRDLPEATKDQPIETLPKIDVDFSQSELHLSSGRVTCYAQYVGSYYVWSTKANKIETETAYRIIARAEVGSGKNATSATVINFVYTNESEVAAVSTPIDGNSNKTSYYLTDGFQTSVVPGTTSTVTTGTTATGSRAPAIEQLGALSGGNNQGGAMGEVNYNSNHFPAGRGNYSLNTVDNQMRNESFMLGGGVLVGNVGAEQNGSGQSEFGLQEPGQGFRIYGNLLCAKKPTASFFSDMKAGKVTRYSQMPYVYVDGIVNVEGSGGLKIGYSHKLTPGDNHAVNLYAGALKSQSGAGMLIHGDVYLWDPNQTSSFLGDFDNSNLMTFLDTNIQKQNISTKGYVGGDVICNNSALEIGGNGTKRVGGDLIMTNPASTLTISGDVVVEGSIVCAGTLNLNRGNIYAYGGVYANNKTGSAQINRATDLATACNNLSTNDLKHTVNLYGTTARANINGALDCNGNVYCNSSTSARIESLGLNYTGESSYSNLVSKILKSGKSSYTDTTYSGADYSLYPFCSRVDEIHERYIRWDLACNSENDAKNYCNGSTADALIAESRACGHSWEAKKFVTDDGTKYFPTTKPIAGGNSLNSFIPEIKLQKSDAVSITYYDTAADVLNAYNNGTALGAYASNSKSVKIVTHKNNGDEAFADLTCDVVESSCTLNLGSCGSNVFINPDAAGYGRGDKKPMVIILKGNASGKKIIINNSASYKSDSGQNYASPKGYYDDPKMAPSREEVVIFFDSDFQPGDNQSFIITSGAYDAAVNGGALTIVSNPIYPTNDKWTSLAKNLKFKYELAPNVTIYGAKGTTYKALNGTVLNANVIMPTCSFDIPSSNWQPSVTYMEEVDSNPVNWNAQKAMSIGSVSVKAFSSTNIPLMIKISDGNRYPGGRPDPPEDEIKYYGNQEGNSNAGNKNTVNNGGDNYLSNDHRNGG